MTEGLIERQKLSRLEEITGAIAALSGPVAIVSAGYSIAASLQNGQVAWPLVCMGGSAALISIADRIYLRNCSEENARKHQASELMALQFISGGPLRPDQKELLNRYC